MTHIMYYDADQKKFITVTLDPEETEQPYAERPSDDMGYGNESNTHAFV